MLIRGLITCIEARLPFILAFSQSKTFPAFRAYLLLLVWYKKHYNVVCFANRRNLIKLGQERANTNLLLLLFHYYVILPYKVKRRRKIRGRNTL